MARRRTRERARLVGARRAQSQSDASDRGPARRAADGLFESRDGLGAHEVIVETPIHDQPLHTLDADRLWRVLWAWRTRIQDLKRDSRFASVVIFKNHGRAAGARLDHAHSQLAAFPIDPPGVADKLRGAARQLSNRRPLHLLPSGRGGIEGRPSDYRAEDAALAIAPYASRVPFETWIVPRDHSARFEACSDGRFKDSSSRSSR